MPAEIRCEKHREKQFIISLIADLNDDEQNLQAMIQTEIIGITSLDTLIDLLDRPEVAKNKWRQVILCSIKEKIYEVITTLQLRTYDADLLKELGFHVLQMNGSRRSKLIFLERMKKNAVELASYLKSQYNL